MDFGAWESLFKLIGYAAILVALWVITVRVFVDIIKGDRAMFERQLAAQHAQFKEISTAQTGQVDKYLSQYREQTHAILDEQSLRNKENFEVLNKFADGIEFLGGQVTSVKSEIATNQFCPLVRKENQKS